MRPAAVPLARVVAAIASVAAVGGCGTLHASAQTAASASASVYAGARAAAASDGDWSEFGYNAQRSDIGPAATGITAKNLGQLSARTVHLPGTVDSSPIQLHGLSIGGRSRDVIVVTTTYGRTLALDAETGKTLWRFAPSDIGSFQGSSQITTATPIADPDRRFVYAASPDGLVHKLSLLTGQQVRAGGWPVSVTFDATHEKIASALNISGANVIVTTGGYFGDAPPYQGHVVVISRATGRIVHVFNSLCSNRSGLIVPSTCSASDSAIWARAGAVIEPGSGRILVATGNAPFNGSTNWGDSVLELTPTASRLLHNWTPTNQAQLNANDADLGSTAPALLGVVNGRSLAVQGGKSGTLSLLNLGRLDGTAGGASARLGGSLQNLSTPSGGPLFTTPAVWHQGGRTWVFVADDSSTAAYVLSGGSAPRLNLAWQRSTPGTSPVLAGGLLYVYDQSGGRLVVYRPTTGNVLRSLPAAPGHWNTPIIVGGRVVLPEGDANAHNTSGTLVIYHLPGR